MAADRDIQDAIASGERNKQAMELIHNWCRHARIQKAGGTGLVELQTGLPIGHHYMACDHAPAGGLATWNLDDAALDFHDRNCIGCTHRIPVRLPNLTSLLQKRDFHRKRAEDERQALRDKALRQRAARQSAREALRAQLNALSATIVDHLEELDHDTTSDAATKLLGAAQLAPETFSPAVVEHCFCLLEAREGWFDEVGLRLLDQLKANQPRLTRCAFLSLGQHRSMEVAAAIVEKETTLAEESLISDALPALVDLANPERLFLIGVERPPVLGPLIAVYRAHRTAVEGSIGKLLDERDPYLVSSGARAIEVLSQVDGTLASRFARSLVAKLARAHLLIDARETGYRGDDEVIQRLQDCVALALECKPDETDALMAEFVAGVSTEAEVRIWKVYEDILRAHPGYSRVISGAAAKVALRRLIGVATASANQDVLREIQGAFAYPSEALSLLAREELTSILVCRP